MLFVQDKEKLRSIDSNVAATEKRLAATKAQQVNNIGEYLLYYDV